MDSITTKLSGNLGERHRCFNALVHEAHSQNIFPLQTHPEESALDRLFKIDLASKQRNIDFIIQILKDDDLLYVNRALKSLWLLDPEYSNIINPICLEHELFPHMISPAVNKMRHWIQMHLRDPQRCQEFYQFYKERDADKGTNFLWHCTNEYLLSEITNVLEKITPKLLKRLSEKVPQITKIYYDSLKHNETLLKYYLKNDSKFYANLKYLLNTDANVFFHILENFFVPNKFAPFSASMTKYIMKHHKSRFLCKPELYTAWFLDTGSLASCLSSDDIKDLVLKLARAEYLRSWFSFQRVELLIKRINEEERDTFKTLVFVDKTFGPMVKEWPYPIPVPPVLVAPQTQVCLFDDMPFLYYRLDNDNMYDNYRNRYEKHQQRTLLDDLFDKYRFFNYEQTFEELQKQLRAESLAKNRQFMFLVLVSKTGGRVEKVVHLLDLLYQHRNEPVHIRATLVRSLVKRACVWRLPPEDWARLLSWAHGLGLDGNTPEAICNEGVHALLIRDLLAGVNPSDTVWKMYINNCFDTFLDYSFTPAERRCIRARLPQLLLAAVHCEQDNYNLFILQCLLDTLKAYCIRLNELPGVVDTAVATFRHLWNTEYGQEAAICLLKRLYGAGIERKYLMKDFLNVIQTDESYVNALQHDISILNETAQLEKLVANRSLRHVNFFRKLALYFMEKDGLGERYRTALEHNAAMVVVIVKNYKWEDNIPALYKGVALPLALLSGSTFLSLLKSFDAERRKTPKRVVAASLRSYAHVVRPAFDLESFGWRKAGAKAVANRVAVCRQRDVERYLQECLTWRHTLRLALVPAKRINKEREIFQILASRRPTAAFHAAMLYFRREQNYSDVRIWEMVKSRILRLGSLKCRALVEIAHEIPQVIRAEYSFLVYMASEVDDFYYKHKALSKIPDVISEIHEQYMFDDFYDFLSEYFTNYETIKRYQNCHRKYENYVSLYIEIIAKFLVVSKSEENLEERYREVAVLFLDQFEHVWKTLSSNLKNKYNIERSNLENINEIERFFYLFLYYIRYNKVCFDLKYVSCVPLLKKILEWVHDFLPLHKFMEINVTATLTMFYVDAARDCLKSNPDLLSQSMKSEGSQMLGRTFAKFVAEDINELALRYFPSVTEIYGEALVNYFVHYFARKNDECFKQFTVAFVNSLVATKSVPACVLGKYIFRKFQDQLKNEHVNDISRQFNESGIRELRVIGFD